MDKDNLHSPIAHTYAQALLDLTVEMADSPGEPEIVAGELIDLKKIFVAEPMVRALFSDPAIGWEERGKLLDRVFGGRVSPLLLKFLQVLNQKGRLNFLDAISGAYQELLDKKLGKVEVDVTVAQRLEPDALADVGRRVSAAIQREAIVHQYVDPSIIGGLILRVQDRLIDGSVRTQLELVRQRLRAAKPAS